MGSPPTLAGEDQPECQPKPTYGRYCLALTQPATVNSVTSKLTQVWLFQIFTEQTAGAGRKKAPVRFLPLRTGYSGVCYLTVWGLGSPCCDPSGFWCLTGRNLSDLPGIKRVIAKIIRAFWQPRTAEAGHQCAAEADHGCACRFSGMLHSGNQGCAGHVMLQNSVKWLCV